MKKCVLYLLPVLLAHLLVSCGLFEKPDERIESQLVGIKETPTLNSDTVGIAWNKNGTRTNINQNSTDYVSGSKIADPCIIKKDGIYHLWFTGVSRAPGGNDFYSIRYAYSTDGITWSNDNVQNYIALAPDASEPGNPSDDCGGVRVGSVIWDNETQDFKMWYRGLDENGTWRILFARSKSPATGWIKYPNTYIYPEGKKPQRIIDIDGLYDRTNIGDLSVNKKTVYDGYEYHYVYEIWYSAEGYGDDPLAVDESGLSKNRIMYAKSDNGLTWDKVELPVLDPVSTAFDFKGKYSPSVIYDSYKGEMLYKMFYIGKKETGPGTFEQKMGLAYSSTGDIFYYYAPDTYETGLTVFPYMEPNPDTGEIYEVKDPWVIRDGYSYKMWYVVEAKDEATNTVTGSWINFVESW